MLKNLLVHIPSERPIRPLVDSAISLAVSSSAHLDAISIGFESANIGLAVDGAAAVDLPALGQSGTTFSNGRQTLIIEQGSASWALGRAVPVACTGG